MLDLPVESASPAERTPCSRLPAIAIILLGLLLAAGVALHWPDWLSGTWYWKWWWMRRAPGPVYGGLAIAALPLFLGIVLFERGKLSLAPVLALITLTAFAERIAWVWAQSPARDLTYLVHAVRHPYITSFYVDAATLSNISDWLGRYHELSLGLNVHSRNKPPGPILFYYPLIKVLGDSQTTALIGGLLLAALQSASVPAAAFFLRVLTLDARIAVFGACYLTLCPGFVVAFPMFDPLYILFVAPMLALWALAIQSDRLAFAAGTGLMFTLASMMMFNFLVVGLFMFGYSLVGTTAPLVTAVFRFARHAAVFVAVTFAAYLLIHATTGYNPIATFAAALRNQRLMDASPLQERPYPQTILFDLVDFALGSGWMSFALAALWAAAAIRSELRAPLTRIGLLCLLQLLIVAISGLLQAETLRVWNFLLPLLMLPVALALARFTAPQRLAVFATLWLILATMARSMTFH